MFRQRRKAAEDGEDDEESRLGGGLPDTKRPKQEASHMRTLSAIIVLSGVIYCAFQLLGTESRVSSLTNASEKLRVLAKQSASRSLPIYVPPVLADNAKISTRHCTADEAARQARYLPAARIRGCPAEDDVWMRFAQTILPQAKIFIDIGSNKGYSAARFFELWTPEFGLNSRLLHQALGKTTKEKELLECGACNDCHEEGAALVPLLPRICSKAAETTLDGNAAKSLQNAVKALCKDRADNFGPIRVLSFDGNPVMVDGVAGARNWLTEHDIPQSTLLGLSSVSEDRLPSHPHKRYLQNAWTIELGAFSDVYVEGKTIEFVLGIGEKGHVAGDEEGLKAFETSDKRAIVPLLTVDRVLEREGFEHVDIIKIDTEGHDPNVLEGAKQTISDSKATLILFEYNKMWPKSTTLEMIVTQMMEPHGYVCYLEGKTVLVKLNFGCWTSALEIRQWSNVWCISLRRPEGLALSTVFDSYSLAFL